MNVISLIFLAKQHQVFNWKDAFSVICVLPGSAGTVFRWGAIINQLLVAKSLGNAFANNYENQILLAWDTAKNVGDPFLRHSVNISLWKGSFAEIAYRLVCHMSVKLGMWHRPQVGTWVGWGENCQVDAWFRDRFTCRLVSWDGV